MYVTIKKKIRNLYVNIIQHVLQWNLIFNLSKYLIIDEKDITTLTNRTALIYIYIYIYTYIYYIYIYINIDRYRYRYIYTHMYMAYLK